MNHGELCQALADNPTVKSVPVKPPLTDTEILNWLEKHPEIQILKDVTTGKVSLIRPFHGTFVSGAPNLRVAVAKAIEKEVDNT